MGLVGRMARSRYRSRCRPTTLKISVAAEKPSKRQIAEAPGATGGKKSV
jgi:hypothetical protein